MGEWEFQFLIGRLITPRRRDTCRGERQFQFLIGRLITIFYLKNFGDMVEFQFLIGRLITGRGPGNGGTDSGFNSS